MGEPVSTVSSASCGPDCRNIERVASNASGSPLTQSAETFGASAFGFSAFSLWTFLSEHPPSSTSNAMETRKCTTIILPHPGAARTAALPFPSYPTGTNSTSTSTISPSRIIPWISGNTALNFSSLSTVRMLTGLSSEIPNNLLRCR